MSPSRHNKAASQFGRVVIVASLGALDAVGTVLAALPAMFPVPVVVVTHRTARSQGQDGLVALLGRRTALPVRTAVAGESAQHRGVTVIPAATTATSTAKNRWAIDRNPNSTPWDALLKSSAQIEPTIVVILTGLRDDGSQGCRAVKRHGGRVLVQDPLTARAASMPTQALATGCIDFVLPLLTLLQYKRIPLNG